MISIIVAIAENSVIGDKNSLLWNIKEDMRRFRTTTTGHPVVMGRKTFESIGRPLPKRTNVVITRGDTVFDGCEMAHSLEEAVKMFSPDEEVFIIGGAQIYKQALPLADKLYLTVVHRNYEGDTSFPQLDMAEWNEIGREEFERGERNASNSYYAQRPAEQLMEDFKSHTGMEMVIPAGFFKATTREESLLWYIRDYPSRAQYIFAFKTPCEPMLSDEMQAFSSLNDINRMFSTISSKGADGSYMRISTEPESLSLRKGIEINGRTWNEIRGWWEVANDFMGGPFVAFENIDNAKGETMVVVFGLYAPEDPQRNLLRELEHLIYTLK